MSENDERMIKVGPLPGRWEPTDSRSGIATSECGNWKLIRCRCPKRSDGRMERHRWFVAFANRATDGRGPEWVFMQTAYYTVTEAKRAVSCEGVIRNAWDRGLL